MGLFDIFKSKPRGLISRSSLELEEEEKRVVQTIIQADIEINKFLANIKAIIETYNREARPNALGHEDARLYKKTVDWIFVRFGELRQILKTVDDSAHLGESFLENELRKLKKDSEARRYVELYKSIHNSKELLFKLLIELDNEKTDFDSVYNLYVDDNKSEGPDSNRARIEYLGNFFHHLRDLYARQIAPLLTDLVRIDENYMDELKKFNFKQLADEVKEKVSNDSSTYNLVGFWQELEDSKISVLREFFEDFEKELKGESISREKYFENVEEDIKLKFFRFESLYNFYVSLKQKLYGEFLFDSSFEGTQKQKLELFFKILDKHLGFSPVDFVLASVNDDIILLETHYNADLFEVFVALKNRVEELYNRDKIKYNFELLGHDLSEFLEALFPPKNEIDDDDEELGEAGKSGGTENEAETASEEETEKKEAELFTKTLLSQLRTANVDLESLRKFSSEIKRLEVNLRESYGYLDENQKAESRRRVKNILNDLKKLKIVLEDRFLNKKRPWFYRRKGDLNSNLEKIFDNLTNSQKIEILHKHISEQEYDLFKGVRNEFWDAIGRKAEKETHANHVFSNICYTLATEIVELINRYLSYSEIIFDEENKVRKVNDIDFNDLFIKFNEVREQLFVRMDRFILSILNIERKANNFYQILSSLKEKLELNK
ncbi:MAG: hypothetical protein ACOCXG_00230 [Nanoarchaeota archaeon]